MHSNDCSGGWKWSVEPGAPRTRAPEIKRRRAEENDGKSDHRLHGLLAKCVQHNHRGGRRTDQEVVAAGPQDGPALSALLDKTSSVAFLFQVTCNADCYFETHKDEIANVVDSWTIQEVRK